MVAFPETWLPGYPWFIWLDSPAWGLQFFQRYFDNFLVYGTPQADRIAAAARDHFMTVVMGHSERQAGSMYIAQWIIGPDGETIAKRRKLTPTHVERTVFGEGDGSDLSVYDTPLGRIGGRAGGAHLGEPDLRRRRAVLRHRPWRHRLEQDGGVLCTDETKRALLKPGGGHAQIFAPDGQLMHQPLAADAEGLIFADLDLGMISLAKAAADPTGHYSRPDVTRLLFNRAPGNRVVLFDAPPVEVANDAHPVPPARTDAVADI